MTKLRVPAIFLEHQARSTHPSFAVVTLCLASFIVVLAMAGEAFSITCVLGNALASGKETRITYVCTQMGVVVQWPVAKY